MQLWNMYYYMVQTGRAPLVDEPFFVGAFVNQPTASHYHDGPNQPRDSDEKQLCRLRIRVGAELRRRVPTPPRQRCVERDGSD